MRVDVGRQQNGQVVVATLYGEFDDCAAQSVRETIDGELARAAAQGLVIDVSGLTFMDSAGIGVILGRYRKCRAHRGRMAVAGAAGGVLRVLRVSGIHKLMPVCPSVADAVRALKEGQE